ncbi:MAG: glycosyltransferase family 4 protein [Candidatus Omnitrophica bacterium]|nr:glycosyltransferase family 4 protein [Candidatus Omnitrophota bacterium]
MKVLFLVPYPIEGPSSRFRVAQYLPYLESRGIKCIFRPFVSSEAFSILYKRGYLFQKVRIVFIGFLKRLKDLGTARYCDVVFIHLEAFPLGPPFLEWVLYRTRRPIVYDLDDAIFLGRTSQTPIIQKLKFPSKIPTIIRWSRTVITCNEYLGNYARRFNREVAVIPTPLDTAKFVPRPLENPHPLVIGWIGSHSTTPFLRQLDSVFQKLGKKYKFTLKVVGASQTVQIPGVHVENIPWSLERDVQAFQEIDIGVYPLPQEEWILGKTGFKTIQYMSVGIPVVASRLGTNQQIIEEGVNGFLVNSEEEWLDKLSLLIENPGLRKKFGEEGRRTVEKWYALEAHQNRMLEVFKNLSREGKLHDC